MPEFAADTVIGNQVLNALRFAVFFQIFGCGHKTVLYIPAGNDNQIGTGRRLKGKAQIDVEHIEIRRLVVRNRINADIRVFFPESADAVTRQRG